MALGMAAVVNRALERKGVESRVDHRSHAERGIDEKPTVHEGASARKMERARQDIIVLTYGIFHNRKGREKDVTGQYQERYDAADAVLARKIDHAKERFDGLREQAAEYDRDELIDARLALRQEMESAAHDRIKRNIKGGKVSIRDYWSSISDADALLGETGMAECRRQPRRREERDHRQEKARRRDVER